MYFYLRPTSSTPPPFRRSDQRLGHIAGTPPQIPATVRAFVFSSREELSSFFPCQLATRRVERIHTRYALSVSKQGIFSNTKKGPLGGSRPCETDLLSSYEVRPFDDPRVHGGKNLNQTDLSKPTLCYHLHCA